MNLSTSFTRKVVYIALIALLLYPLFLIGQPPSRAQDDGSAGSAGGALAQMRDEHRLGQANLGQIDPASESVKLATLGMRGVAANILWSKAFQYKKTEEWDALSATVNQIIKLQPNFIKVWEFQSHNLAYNVSVEFDDYRHRYHWVKKGLIFLLEGTRHNSREPRLQNYMGWITGQKMGRSDERELFRPLFSEDKDYHGSLADSPLGNPRSNRQTLGPNQLPDSWLVARRWYRLANSLFTDQGASLRGKAPLLFLKDAPMATMNYAMAIENEGFFQQVARTAWRDAGDQWSVYGSKPIPSSWGQNIRLLDLDSANERINELRAELDKLTGNKRQSLRDERYATLTNRERMSVETPQEEWTEDLFLEATAAHEKINVTDVEVADFAPRQDRRRANEILDEIRITSIYVYRISRYRDIVNFTYWATRCEIEQTETAALAREKVYLGKKALDEASLPKAREHYDIAWEKWAELFKKYPELANDDTLEDLAPHLNSYQVLLRQMDEELPSDFPLRDILDGKKAAAGEPAPRLPDRLRITPRTEAADAKDPVDAKEPDAKDADSKDADAKDADSKDADAKDADSKDADSKDADSKDADSKDADAEAASESAADSDPKQAAASKPEADQP